MRDGLELNGAYVASLQLVDSVVGGAGIVFRRGPTQLVLDRCQVERIELSAPSQMEGLRISKSTTVVNDVRLVNLKIRDLILSARFGGEVDLSRAEISGQLVVDGNFTHCPKLFDTKMSAQTRLDEIRIGGKPIGSAPIGGYPAGTNFRAEVAAVRALRIEAQTRRWTREEVVLFAQEQRLERHLTTSPVVKTVSWLYDVASVYGSSVPRAMASLLLWNLSFGVLFWALRWIYSLQLPSAHSDYWLGLSKESMEVVGTHSELASFPAIALAFQNVFNPLGLGTDKGLVRVQTLWGLFLSTVQVVGSIGLIALLLLALRSRFQRSGSGGGST